ncbi:MAG: sulfotransferase domain-containing protein [Coleofasciculus sp.]|uniref:sulfotransferase domain-containing protein n=1 Tax=Coleofasciculus sp. TaxID=3100458 RepID=UPI003A3B120B
MSDQFNPTRRGNTTQLTKDDSAFNYVLITGPGRSGTTWLGQMMNTYEHCVYKYEPFGRSKGYKDWRSDLESADVEELRHRFASVCSNFDHDVDLPPFPAKSFRWQNPQLLHLLHSLGTRVEALKLLYHWYGQTKLTPQTPILIKDVNFPTPLLPRLCEVLQPKLIGMIRNPFGRIASTLKGKELNQFNQRSQSEKIEGMRRSIDAIGGNFLSEYRDRLEEMSDMQLDAVIWRIQVEPLVEYTRSYDQGLVVVYEDLCNDPQGKITEIFDFVGWELGQTTRDFIKESTAGERQLSDKSKAYFSVYRDPRISMSKWKTQLTHEQQADIASVIRDSPLKELWSDLPL